MAESGVALLRKELAAALEKIAGLEAEAAERAAEIAMLKAKSTEQALLRKELAASLEKIAGLEAEAAERAAEIAMLKAKSTEQALLRKELAAALEKIAGLEAENSGLKAKAAEQAVRLAVCDGPNAPSSSLTTYGPRRNAWRKERGYKGSDGAGSDGKPAPDGGAPRKMGPPQGHKGVSHCNKPEFTMKCGILTCPVCCGPLEKFDRWRKLVNDFDQFWRVVTAMIEVETGWCGRCEKYYEAQAPFPKGTSCGPRALGLIMALFEMGCTDARIAGFIESTFYFRISEAAVAKARRAMAGASKKQLEEIKWAFRESMFVHMDETGFKIGVLGKTGYVWVAVVGNAVWVHFAPTRGAAVLREHFGWLSRRAVVADGLPAYRAWFQHLQRCCRHLLAKGEAVAVDGDPGDEARHDWMQGYYHKIHGIKTLAPFTVTYLAKEFHDAVSAYPEGKLKTHLANAEPHVLTFMGFRGMPPHNNPAELAIRDLIVTQRNAHHKISTPEGRKTFSELVTIGGTARMNGMFPGRAFTEIARNRDWKMFDPGPWAGPDWCVFDDPASGLVRPPGSAAGRAPAPAAASA